MSEISATSQVNIAQEPTNTAKEAVETTVDLLQLILSIGMGVFIGVIIAFVVVAVVRVLDKRSPELKPFLEACTRPFVTLCGVLGARIGFRVLEGVKDATNPSWFISVGHFFLILLIASATWLVVGIVNAVVALIYSRMSESSERRAARLQTQTQILHRVVVVVIWVLGFAGILLTFPSAKAAGTSLFASAGLVSVVAGLAAQTTLGNIFAGLQLAFTDSIRVGDIVQYKGNYTSVEEITLTYVVLAVWDGRRIIVPSSLMTTQDFENWTRRKPDMVGEVTWEVDWAIPIEAARKQFLYLLNQTDLWDGKTGVLSIKEAQAQMLVLRAVVSATDSATLSDLKYYLREKMVLWIQREAPQAIPNLRYSQYAPLDIAQTQEETEKLVEARLQWQTPVKFLPENSESETDGKEIAVDEDAEPTKIFATQELRKLGIKLAPKNTAKSNVKPNVKNKKLEKNVEKDSVAEEKNAKDNAKTEKTQLGESAETIVMPRIDGKKNFSEAERMENMKNQEGHESSLFTGSPEAEQRKIEFSGPGNDAYEERNRKIAQTNATGDLKAIQVKEEENSEEEPE